MEGKKLYIIYVIIGVIGAITTQALPIIYSGYGYDSTQIYNLISIVFLATAFQPLIGYIIDKYFTQKHGINILLTLTGVVSFVLIFITKYDYMLFTIMIFSIFRIPLFAIVDGYASTLSHKHDLNIGLIRSGAMIGYGFGILLLILFLTLFGLTANYSFLLITILAISLVIFLNIGTNEEDKETDSVTTNVDNTNTKWDVFILLVIM